MNQNISRRNTAIIILAIVVMMAGMIGSIYYPFPSGQSMDVAGFVKLWLRELLILGVIVIAIIFAVVSWLWQRFKPSNTGKQNAP